MAINRIHKTDSFVQIPNSTLRDRRLTYRAKGVLAFMLTHVDGWVATAETIADASAEGRTAVLSALKELEKYGYREVVRSRGSDGKWTTTIHWYEVPKSGSPESGYPTSEDPTV